MNVSSTSSSVRVTFQGRGQQEIPDDDLPQDDPQTDPYTQGIEEGKRFCFQNPEACGIDVSTEGYTAADLEAARKAGYQEGITSCSSSVCDTVNAATYNLLSNTLHIPVLELGAPVTYWADFSVIGGEPLTLILKAVDTNSREESQ